MKKSNEHAPKPAERKYQRLYSPNALLVIGLGLGLVGIYAVDGWLQWLLLGLGTACLAFSRWLSYMEHASLD